MLEKFSLSLTLFYLSIIFPYLQLLLIPQTISLTPLISDFAALVVLAISSIILAFGTKLLRQSGKGIIYPVAAVGAVVAYFYSFDTLQHTGDYLNFQLHKPRLEAYVAKLNNSPIDLAAALAASTNHQQHAYLEGGEWFDVLPSYTIICTTGGAESERYWGYAYSATGKKPSQEDESVTGGKFYYWHRLDGHWYMWIRSDG